MDGVLMALRVIVSLAVVVALVWYLARKLGGRGRDTSREAEVRVLDRQSLSRHSGVAVVAAGDRRLLVGFADAGVQLITELRPVPELPKLPQASDDERGSRPARPGPLPRPSAAAPAAATTSTASPASQPAGPPVALPAGLPGNRQPGLLAGSVLSPQTWHATVRAWQDRTVRR